MLVGWCSVAEIVSSGQGAIRRCTERRHDCADDEPADVVGSIPRRRGRMVSNVAVENVEWAGRGIPNVYHCRSGVLGCGATRANSRLVGKPYRITEGLPVIRAECELAFNTAVEDEASAIYRFGATQESQRRKSCVHRRELQQGRWHFLCAENRQGYSSMDCWYERGYDLSAGIPTSHVA